MASAVLVFVISTASSAQVMPGRQQPSACQARASQSSDSGATLSSQDQGEEGLRKGTALTQRGSFSEAIPHLLAA